MAKIVKYAALFLPFIILVILRISLGFDGRYGQDPYAYAEYASALRKLLTDGTHPGAFFWPVLYPAAGCSLSFIYPDIVACLQIISVLSLVVTIFFGAEIIRLLYPEQKSLPILYFFVFGFLTPYMFRFGITLMSDSFSIALLMIGVYCILKYAQSEKFGFITTGSFFIGMAVMSRYALVVLCFPFIVYGFYAVWKSKLPIPKSLLIIVFLLLPMTPHLLLHQSETMEFIRHPWILTWSPINFFKRSFSTVDGQSVNILPNLLYTFLGLFHPRYFLIGLPFMIIGWKKFVWNKEQQVLVVGLLVYLLFLSGIPFQNNRFLLPAFPILLIFVYPAIRYGVALLGEKLKPLIWGTIIITQIIFTTISLWPVWKRYQFEQQVVSYCMQLSPATVYSLDLDLTLKGHHYLGEINNLYTTFYEEVDSNAILIIHPQIIHTQWKNMMPERNIDHFKSKYSLNEIKSFNNGWKVFRIE